MELLRRKLEPCVQRRFTIQFSEIYYKTILAEIKVEKYFSAEYFETELMQKAVDDYVNGKEDLY
jgi:hypothetical protein